MLSVTPHVPTSPQLPQGLPPFTPPLTAELEQRFLQTPSWLPPHQHERAQRYGGGVIKGVVGMQCRYLGALGPSRGSCEDGREALIVGEHWGKIPAGLQTRQGFLLPRRGSEGGGRLRGGSATLFASHPPGAGHGCPPPAHCLCWSRRRCTAACGRCGTLAQGLCRALLRWGNAN